MGLVWKVTVSCAKTVKNVADETITKTPARLKKQFIPAKSALKLHYFRIKNRFIHYEFSSLISPKRVPSHDISITIMFKKLKALYIQYKPYVRVDLVMYAVMVLLIILYFIYTVAF